MCVVKSVLTLGRDARAITSLEYALLAAFVTVLMGGAVEMVGQRSATMGRAISAVLAPEAAPLGGVGGVSSD